MTPSGSSSAFTIDLATRPVSASRTSHASMPSPETTACAARASKLPENTLRRSNTTRSRSSSNEYDQSTAARKVWWRSTVVWRPPVSSRNRSSSSPRMSPGLNAATRAAASSIARGIPSRRTQISPTAPAFVSLSTNPGRAAWARSTNSRTASHSPTLSSSDDSGSVSDASGQICSPATPKPSRLVAKSRTSGQARQDLGRETGDGTQLMLAVVQDQQLRFGRNASTMLSLSDTPWRVCTPKVAATT